MSWPRVGGGGIVSGAEDRAGQYADIFDHRARSYASAMLAMPHARDAEFEALFGRAPVKAGQRVLDVPAGAGDLGRRLADAQVVGLEFSRGFGAGVPVVGIEDAWPLEPDLPFDHAVCLAALHHLPGAQGQALLRRLMSCLRPGGVLHVADVCPDSPVARFLDGFCGRFNGTGHTGSYREFHPSGWSHLGRVLRCEQRAVPWNFADVRQMLAFTRSLFGLTDCPDELLLGALDSEVGVASNDGGVRLLWSLGYVDVAAA